MQGFARSREETLFKRARSYLRNVIAFVGSLVLAACAHAPAPREDGCSLPGRGQWREYVSKHFLIDAEEGADPGKLVAAFEELRAAVVRALLTAPIEVPTRVRVVALPTREDVRRVLGTRGVFMMTNLDREPTIVISAEDVNSVPQIVAHELAHMVSYHVLPRQKFWFAEGLAQFVESVATIDAEGRRWAGRQPRNTSSAGQIRLMPTEALFNSDPKQGETHAFYLTSWLL